MPELSTETIQGIARDAIELAFAGHPLRVHAMVRDDYWIPDDDTGRVVLYVQTERPLTEDDDDRRRQAQLTFLLRAGQRDTSRLYSLMFQAPPAFQANAA